MNRYLGLRQLAHPKLYKSVAVGDVLIQKNNVTSTWSEGFGVHEDLMPAVEDSDGLCRGLKPLRCSALFSLFLRYRSGVVHVQDQVAVVHGGIQERDRSFRPDVVMPAKVCGIDGSSTFRPLAVLGL